MNDRDDLYYIDLVRNGDTAAYSFLVERYSEMVYSIALKMLRSPIDAEDLAQEIFITAFKSLDKFKGNARFSTWIYRITYNKAVSILRRSKKVTITENERYLENHGEAEHQMMGLSDEEETIKELRVAIEELPDEEQVLIMLYYFEEQSVEDISRITSLSAANVKVKLFRTRKKLKSLFESRNPDLIPVFR